MFLGLACFVPRFRRTAALVATAFHLATFAVLAFRLRWDAAVWPWKLALAAAGPGLLVPWRGPGLGVDFALARRRRHAAEDPLGRPRRFRGRRSVAGDAVIPVMPVSS